MRVLLLLLTCCFVQLLTAQRREPVTWLTPEGKVVEGFYSRAYSDKGIVQIERVRLYELDTSSVYRKYKRVTDYADIDMIVYEGDTIVRRAPRPDYQELPYRRPNARDRRLQRRYGVEPYTGIVDSFFNHTELMADGEVMLYKALVPNRYRHYFLRYQGVDYRLDRENAKDLAVQISGRPCAAFDDLAKKITNDYQALEVQAAILECMDQPAPERRILLPLPRWEVGVAFRAEDDTDQQQSLFLRVPSTYLLRPPWLSLTGAYRPFKRYPGVSLEMQARMHLRFSEAPLQVDGVVYPSSRERLEVVRAYVLPGANVRVLQFGKFSYHIGMGLSIAAPLHFRRIAEFTDRDNVPLGYPVFQDVTAGSSIRIGQYVKQQFRLDLNDKWQIFMQWRNERLDQSIRDSETGEQINFGTSTRFTRVAPVNSAILQFGVTYRME